jgi:hypothetical protein
MKMKKFEVYILTKDSYVIDGFENAMSLSNLINTYNHTIGLENIVELRITEIL